MRPLAPALPLLAVILVALPLQAETLGEAAAREAARRKPGASKKAPVYTGEELARAGTNGTFNAMSGPVKERSPSAIEPASPSVRQTESSKELAADEPERRGGRTEAQWRARAAELHEIIRVQSEQVKIHEKNIGGVAQTKLVCSEGPMCANPIEGTDSPVSRLEMARALLTYAQEALEELEDEARRRSVPPGWLRER
jgi:hypothetical protein